MIQAHRNLNTISVLPCNCDKITMFHNIGFCSIISHVNKILADSLNKSQGYRNVLPDVDVVSDGCEDINDNQNKSNNNLFEDTYNKIVIAIDFSVLHWKIIGRLIKDKKWPTYNEVFESYTKVIGILEDKLTTILGDDKYIIYAFVDGYAENRLKYLTRFNRSYETTVTMVSSFPILSPGSHLWKIIQSCYDNIKDTNNFKMIQCIGESDGYMTNYLKKIRDSKILICSIDSDISLLALQLSNCVGIISLTQNKVYNFINNKLFREIVFEHFVNISDFLFIFYFFVRNDYHYGIEYFNDPSIFFDKIMPLAKKNYINLSDFNNLLCFLKLISNNYGIINKHNNTEHGIHFIKITYSIMSCYYIDAKRLDTNTSTYYKSPIPIDIHSIINTIENVCLRGNIPSENYVYTHRNLFIETLVFFPNMDYNRFEKVIQRMFPVNDSNINDILELWNIFKTIKNKKCITDKRDKYYDNYGNRILIKNKKLFLPIDFEHMYNNFYDKSYEIIKIYDRLSTSNGKLPDCTDIIAICRDFERFGRCKYEKCKFRHIKANKYL